MSGGGRLLIVDDDPMFCKRIARVMAERGLEADIAHSLHQCAEMTKQYRYQYATLDVCLLDDRGVTKNGLEAIPMLKQSNEKIRIVILTGFGSIVSAVTAMKLGAFEYLSKPPQFDQIYDALTNKDSVQLPPPPLQPITPDRLRWEYIKRTHDQCKGNVSETARRLRMHRRTLQRILNKRPPIN